MKFLFSLMAFCLLFSTVKAQQADTAAWCPPGATWVYRTFSATSGAYLKYSYEKDTVILNQAVKKIAVSRLQYYSVSPILGRIENHLGYEYEYMSNDSLYFYDPTSNSFILKFDFNATVGDSLIVRNPRSTCNGNSNFPDQDTLYIDSISAEISGQIAFERYNLSSGNYTSFYFSRVIKNIGSADGFHPEISRLACSSSLATYGEFYEGFAFYQDSVRGRLFAPPYFSDSLANNIISSIFRTESGISAAKEVRVFPNPAQDELWLDIALNGALNLSIYNLAGQEVRHFQLHQNHFSIRDLPKGMYILYLRTDDQQFYQTKFVKL